MTKPNKSMELLSFKKFRERPPQRTYTHPFRACIKKWATNEKYQKSKMRSNKNIDKKKDSSQS